MIVSQFAWSLIVIDRMKVFCRILGMMHMTRKIASEQDESMADIEPPPLKIKTFQAAMQSLENVQHFLERSHGLLQQAMSIGDAVDDVSGFMLASSTQTTLHDYFQ